MRLLYRRILHAIDNHGLAGAARRLLRRDRLTAGILPPAPDRDESTVHPFDLQHGTDTSGYTPGEHVADASSGSGLYVTGYYGISPSTLTEALRRFPEPVAPFTFVDLGCGKGRALLLAAGHPFHAVLGVELDPTLAQTARQNAGKLASSSETAPRLQILTHDATTVPLPETPLLIFLYHPFLAPVLRRVLAHLGQSLAQHPRPAYLLYANPNYFDTLADFPWLETLWDAPLFLSPEDAAADRHGITYERYILFRANPARL